MIWSSAFNFFGVMASSGAVAFAVLSPLPVELILQVGHPHRMVADWDCIVCKVAEWVRDGRVDPRVKPEDGHDGGGAGVTRF